MADLTITAASVVPAVGATIEKGYSAGATITAGQAVYLSSSSVWQLCDANTSATTAAVGGIALHGASSGQPLAVITRGGVNVGATLTVGEIYIPSGTAGGIAPVADLTAGWFTAILGIATTASNLDVQLHRGGVAKA